MHPAAPLVGTRPTLLSTFGAFRHRDYQLYWFGQLFAVLSLTFEVVAVGWLVLQLTNSATSLGLTGLAQTVPRVILVLLGGAIADRVDRRRLLVVMQGISGLLYFALATLVVSGLVQVWEVMVFAFLLGCVRSFDGPARAALLPHVVPREDLANAVPLGNAGWELARLIGPATAGVLIAAVGIGSTIYIASLGYLGAMVLYGLLRVDQTPLPHRGRGLLLNVMDGFDFIRRDHLIAGIIGLTFFCSIFGMAHQTLLPVFAKHVLDVGPMGLGFMVSASGGGAMAGSLAVAYLAPFGGRGGLALMTSALYGALVLGFALSPWYALSLGLLVAAGIANGLYTMALSTALQLKLTDEFRGRVMGMWNLHWGLPALGGTILGALAEHASAPLAVAAGGLLVVVVALCMAVALPAMRRLD